LFSRRIRFVTSFPVTNGLTYSLSFTPASGIFGLGYTGGEAIPSGTLIQVIDGESVPQDNDLAVSITISPDTAVPVRNETWGAMKAIYR
jgi:hypothetical protein